MSYKVYHDDGVVSVYFKGTLVARLRRDNCADFGYGSTRCMLQRCTFERFQSECQKRFGIEVHPCTP